MRIISYGHIEPLEVFCKWCGAMFECTPADTHYNKHIDKYVVDCPVCGKPLSWTHLMKGEK